MKGKKIIIIICLVESRKKKNEMSPRNIIVLNENSEIESKNWFDEESDRIIRDCSVVELLLLKAQFCERELQVKVLDFLRLKYNERKNSILEWC